MEYKDYYKTLGVERNATQDEIKTAYRRLARKYHPDVSAAADAETRFKTVGEAYDVLKDPEKRQAYDQLGNNWKDGQNFRPPPGWENFSGGSQPGGGGFADLFESLFNNGFSRSRGGNNKGSHQQVKITIDLEDAVNGAKRSINLRTASGGTRTLNVNIPKGVKAGQKIRLAGQGNTGTGGAGDLLLEIEFRPHPRFEIDGRDLYLTVPLAPWEAALGASVTIPLPSGSKADIKIPANSQSGRKMRLKGKGIPGKPAGDLLLKLEVVLPAAKTEQDQALYEQMAQQMSFNPRPYF